MNQIVINADNIEALKQYEDNYFDSIVTDPPYGLGKEPIADEVMRDWLEKGYHEVGGSGFMGKEWDSFIPQPIFWKEVFRVLKHGGHVVSFFGTRTYDWGVMAMRFAGFEVRDCIQWIYGSGFPKSHNISKAIDKLFDAEREVIGEKIRGDVQKAKENGSGYLSDPANRNNEKQFGYGTELLTKPKTEKAKEWDGWGSALKPANEPIVLARKPLEKGLSIAENVLKWGTGGINIDGCRVGEGAKKWETPRGGIWATDVDAKSELIDNPQGRFPANLILTHHPECECKGIKKVKGITGGENNIIVDSKFGQVSNIPQKPFNYADENGEETIQDWDCHQDCPIKIMDEKSGISKTGDIKPHQEKGTGIIYGNGNGFFSSRDYREVNFKGDVGGASRFFYCAKASKSERNQGLEGFEEKENKHSTYGIHSDEGLIQNGRNPENRSRTMSNFHPTVKPVKLMQYLVKLITPPNGKVLDPFCGSGTTGIACKLEGFEFVGIEQDAEYSKIAQSRIDNYEEEIEEIVYVTNEEGEKVQIIQTSLF
jgi:site-specific DNA-methyltransferase (adenine-specific)